MTSNKKSNKNSMYHPHEIEWTSAKISNLWDYYSKNVAYQDQYFSYQAGKIVLHYIQRYINPDGIYSILDYGCGTGSLLNELLKRAKKDQKCFGLDFSKESVVKVNRKYTKHPKYGKTVWIEKLPSPFINESMDLIISLDVIEHLDDEQLPAMINEIHRILRPCGYLILTTPNKENLEGNKTICPDCGCIFHRYQHMRNWSCLTLREEMEKGGFNTLHIAETNFAMKYQRLIKLFLKFEPKYKKNLIYIGQKNIACTQ